MMMMIITIIIINKNIIVFIIKKVKLGENVRKIIIFLLISFYFYNLFV